MKMSQLFTKTTKDVPSDEKSLNARMLMKAGYIDKLTAGVYSYLPLGLSVIRKISDIVREEMNGIGGQELFLPTLHPKANWDTTGRWESYDVLFRLQSQWGNEYAVGPTHEEVIVPLARHHVNSYKDLPFSVYQIQTKFRDEARAKSGILRGREFLMKDLYSFHRTDEDRKAYYQKAIEAYKRVFNRCGFSDVFVTEASGGDFSEKLSHEFQVLTEAGEDTIVLCRQCQWAQNTELAEAKAGDTCSKCKDYTLEESKAIEAGNIFDLGTKFAQDFDLTFQDEEGNRHHVVIGCYGIGISRLMGALVEDRADDNGLKWPIHVAPYHAHIVQLGDDEEITAQAKNLASLLEENGIEYLHDDRDVSAGEKFADADLLGMPVRLVISKKTGGKVEWKIRGEEVSGLLEQNEVNKRLEDMIA